eukprot:6188087-Pleurochrysis_carterae.AAC.3
MQRVALLLRSIAERGYFFFSIATYPQHGSEAYSELPCIGCRRAASCCASSLAQMRDASLSSHGKSCSGCPERQLAARLRSLLQWSSAKALSVASLCACAGRAAVKAASRSMTSSVSLLSSTDLPSQDAATRPSFYTELHEGTRMMFYGNGSGVFYHCLLYFAAIATWLLLRHKRTGMTETTSLWPMRDHRKILVPGQLGSISCSSGDCIT